MATGNVLLPKQIDASKLKFSEPRTLPSKARTVYANYEADRLSVQTPIMRLPYGVGDWNDKDTDEKTQVNKKYDLNLSFAGSDVNPKMRVFLEKMQEIEKRVIDAAFENRLSWLDDDYDGIRSVVAKLFSPIIKIDKDKDTKKVVGKYPPTMKVKLPFDNKSDSFSFTAQDMNGEELDFKSIMTSLKGGKARVIMQLSGIWIAAGRYGCTWKVVKAMLEPTARANVDFVQDSDDENETSAQNDDDSDVVADALANINVLKNRPPTPKTSTTQPSNPLMVQDSDPDQDDNQGEGEGDGGDDGEDGNGSDASDEPPPPPPPPKSRPKTGTLRAKK